jgi:hypothetical protein
MQIKSLRRRLALALTALALVGGSGCFGSFNLVRKVYGFNKGVSTNKFAREFVFLAFNIVPVYGAAGFVDAVVVNTVEFWSGKNPVQMASRIRLDSATTLTRVVYDGPAGRFMTIKAFRFDTLVSTTTIQVIDSDDVGFQTVLADGRQFSNIVRMTESGDAVLTGGNAPLNPLPRR